MQRAVAPEHLRATGSVRSPRKCAARCSAALRALRAPPCRAVALPEHSQAAAGPVALRPRSALAVSSRPPRQRTACGAAAAAAPVLALSLPPFAIVFLAVVALASVGLFCLLVSTLVEVRGAAMSVRADTSVLTASINKACASVDLACDEVEQLAGTLKDDWAKTRALGTELTSPVARTMAVLREPGTAVKQMQQSLYALWAALAATLATLFAMTL